MRQVVYRVAFDEASAELSEILNRFEQLRSRKDRVEKVVEALKPLLAGNESPAPALSLHAEWAPASVQTPTSAPVPIHTPVQVPVAASVPVSVPVQAPPPPPPAPMPMAQQVEYAAASIVSQAPASLASAPIPYPVQQAVDETNDPFARRAETSVGLGSATRDVREYSRLFNTGTARGN